MLGLAALNTFDDVLMEDPELSNPKNPNPDLIIRHGTARFGIACKSLSSKSKTNFRERIGEALRQIDTAVVSGNIDKRRGIVLLDISALLDHNASYLPSQNEIWKAEDISQVLLHIVDTALYEIFGTEHGIKVKEHIGDLFDNTQAAPCVIIYAHTLMIAASGEVVGPRYMKSMRALYVGDHSKVKAFSESLNRALHGQ
jgi:hypothetical protein